MKIIKKGILSNSKDLGKNGWRHLGINPRGAMDKFTLRLLNILLQKQENEEVLEIYFPAPEILFETDCTIVIGGADFSPMIDNQIIENWKVTKVNAGSTLKFKRKVAGNIAYLVVNYNFSENSFLPYLGNVGQVFNLSNNTEIRFIVGNEHQFLTKKSKQNLENQAFKISQNSNRMGFRMIAEPLEVDTKIELVSSAIDFGTIQLLPDGQIIILMAEHQTSGGYPRIGNIISIDLPKLAQCTVNQVITLKEISIDEAENLIILQEKEIQKLKASIRFFNGK